MKIDLANYQNPRFNTQFEREWNAKRSKERTGIVAWFDSSFPSLAHERHCI